MISEVYTTGVAVPASKARGRDQAELHREAKEPEGRQKTTAAEDSVTIRQKSESAEEVSYRTQLETARQLGARFLMLRDLVAKTFTEQGLSTALEIGGGKTVDVRDLTPEQARELVDEDGYWGVEQTSDRIVQFALSLAKDDVSLLEKIKAGVVKGFEQAKQDFGGELPDISQKTFDAVMSKLDDWAKEHQEEPPTGTGGSGATRSAA